MSASAIPSIHAMRTAALAEAFGSNAAAFAELLEEGQKVNYDSCKSCATSHSCARASGFGSTRTVSVAGNRTLESVEGTGDEGQAMETRLPRSGVRATWDARTALGSCGLADWMKVDRLLYPGRKCASSSARAASMRKRVE